MKKNNSVQPQETNFKTEPIFELDGFMIAKGDIVKVVGEYGSKFKVVGLTTNTITGSVWVDCFEIIRGVSSQFRAFKLERIKRIPQRGKRARRVI